MEPGLRQTILDLETAFWHAMRDKDGAAAARLCGDTGHAHCESALEQVS